MLSDSFYYLNLSPLLILPRSWSDAEKSQKTTEGSPEQQKNGKVFFFFKEHQISFGHGNKLLGEAVSEYYLHQAKMIFSPSPLYKH